MAQELEAICKKLTHSYNAVMQFWLVLFEMAIQTSAQQLLQISSWIQDKKNIQDIWVGQVGKCKHLILHIYCTLCISTSERLQKQAFASQNT